MAKEKPARGKKPRAARGTGSVMYSARRGCWIARKPVGVKLGPGGKRQTLYLERHGATQAEAIRKRDAALPPGPTTTVKEWAERWLTELDHRPLTVDSYTHSVRTWIIPVLGGQPVRSLTAHLVESAARRWGEHLGANTVRLVLSHLRACLAAAVRAQLLVANPVASAKKPKGTKTKIDPFTPEELAQIVAEATKNPGDRILALLAATGCRRGEAIALDVSDFDPAARKVAITKGDIGRHGIGPPKSEPSVRTISVPAKAIPAVRAAIGKRREGPMFQGRGGGRISDSTVGERFDALLRRLGLRDRNLHQLKHSVATMLTAPGGDTLGDAAAYLGDRVETLVRHYVQPTGSDPARTIDRLLGGGKVAVGSAKRARKPVKQAPRRKSS